MDYESNFSTEATAKLPSQSVFTTALGMRLIRHHLSRLFNRLIQSSFSNGQVHFLLKSEGNQYPAFVLHLVSLSYYSFVLTIKDLIV